MAAPVLFWHFGIHFFLFWSQFFPLLFTKSNPYIQSIENQKHTHTHTHTHIYQPKPCISPRRRALWRWSWASSSSPPPSPSRRRCPRLVRRFFFPFSFFFFFFILLLLPHQLPIPSSPLLSIPPFHPLPPFHSFPPLNQTNTPSHRCRRGTFTPPLPPPSLPPFFSRPNVQARGIYLSIYLDGWMDGHPE